MTAAHTETPILHQTREDVFWDRLRGKLPKGDVDMRAVYNSELRTALAEMLDSDVHTAVAAR